MADQPTDSWLYRAARGLATEAEQAEVRAWRAEHAENERRYVALVKLLETDDRFDAGIDPGPAPVASELIWRAEAKTAAGGLRRRAGWGSRWWLGGFAVAAAVLIALAITRFGSPVRGDAFEGDDFITGKSELATVRLRDGSVVRLGPESRLQLQSQREVRLEGQAFFAVAKQHGRPFRVRTSAGDAVVLGTRFQVEANRGDLRLLVLEGRVVLSGKGQEVELGAGNASSMLDGKIGPIVTVPNAHRMIDWVQNFLVFQETPLRDAVKEIESHYGVRVSIADTLLMSRTLTMWFADRTLEDVLTAVCTVIDAKCWINDKTVTIGP